MVPYDHKVQYYETDGMGIVHHSNYIRWFEEARVDLLEQLGFGYDRIEEAGYSGPVLEVSCQYKTMSKFGETVRIEASITQYNGVRMTLHYDVYDKATGTLRCTGDSRHCFINAEGKPAAYWNFRKAQRRKIQSHQRDDRTRPRHCLQHRRHNDRSGLQSHGIAAARSCRDD